MTKTYEDKAVLLSTDGLVQLPSVRQMRQKVTLHVHAETVSEPGQREPTTNRFYHLWTGNKNWLLSTPLIPWFLPPQFGPADEDSVLTLPESPLPSLLALPT